MGIALVGRKLAEPWHALAPDEVERLLGTSPRGLSGDEARERLAAFGPNQLEEEPPTPAILVLLRQFRSPLIYILLAATVVTLLLEEYIDAGVIAAVLALNATIGFAQERRAEHAVRALQQLVVPHARVVRDGREWEIDSRDLAPGDVVLLEPGARVPADLRLVGVNGLQIDESLLTGESLPRTKRATEVSERAPIADRVSMAYTGTVVTSGRGHGLVVATGARTALGEIAGMIRSETAEETPLQQRMARFARVIGIAIGMASIVAFASGVLLGESVHDMFLTAVALAVAAIPEGLPVVFTITLALGVRRMARRNAIVRRLPAVETLGSTTVIGSDKTGTLTENRMTVQQIWAGGEHYTLDTVARCIRDARGRTVSVDGGGHEALRLTLLAGALTNEAEAYDTSDGIRFTGDPTDAALLVSAMAGGLAPDEERDDAPVLAEIPFEPDRRYSATVRRIGERDVMFVKGAPERVVEMCAHTMTQHGIGPIDGDEIHAASRRMAREGLRVLAMAMREATESLASGGEVADPGGLVFCGLQGMLDPPRAGVRDAVQACRDAGVRVVMITGDHAITARAISQRLGIAGADGDALTGTDIASMPDERLQERVDEVSVFARVSPEEKLRIVRALERRGEVVAVTGDGVNDAPALKAAAIGIAMGRGGTDVAREAADMVLADDNFVSIAAAIEEGRVTFDNLRKATFFLVSTGVATIVAILFGVWAQWPLLMLPAQLLWLNLVTNGLQDVALAFEPGERGVLERPPRRPSEGVLSRLLWQRAALAGTVMAAATLVLFRWELDRTDTLARAQTVALTTMVIAMAFHAGNARSESTSVFRLSPVSNPFLFVATACAVAIHVAALYLPPTQYVLRVEPLELAAWVRVLAAASTVLIVVEIDKLLRGRRRSGTGR